MEVPGELTAVEIQHAASAYPRFRYFQENLDSVAPRFQRIIEVAKLYKCISQGQSKFHKILVDAKDFSGKHLPVTVLSQDVETAEKVHEEMKVDRTELQSEAEGKEVVSKETIEKSSQPSKLDETDVQEKKITSWRQFLEKSRRTVTPVSVIVFAFKSSDMENHSLQTKLSHLSSNDAICLVYDVSAKVNYSLTELHNVQFDARKLQLMPLNSSLSNHVQYLLEERAVRMLEEILQFSRNFSPKTGQEPEIKLLDHLCNEIMKSLTDENTLEDLSPLPKFKDASSAPSSDDSPEELDEKFHNKLVDYLGRKCKCLICDELAKKYGIKASMVNDFLNDNHYDFPGKFDKSIREMSLPPYDCLDDPRRKTEFRYFAYTCASHTEDIVKGAEKYICKLINVLGLLEQLEFEICSLLRLSKVPKNVHVPDIPDLPPALQSDILGIEGVEGCGTIYGKLTVSVSGRVTNTLNEEIRSTLRCYNYIYPFLTQSFKKEIRMKAGGREPDAVESGSYLKADFIMPKNPDEPSAFGSLGCFVDICSKKKEPGEAATKKGATEKKKHFLTCAHVFKDTDNRAHVKINDNYVHIGNKSYDTYVPLSLDIAAVEVFENHLKICTKEVKKPCNVLKTDKWSILSKDEECGLYPVYMAKCSGRAKHGQIICYDYIEGQNLLPDNGPMSRHYSILIQPLADVDEEIDIFAEEDSVSKQFSEHSDSGSIICMRELNGNGILVVALLCGAVYDHGKYKYSYGGHLGRSLHRLAEDKGLEIEPANES